MSAARNAAPLLLGAWLAGASVAAAAEVPVASQTTPAVVSLGIERIRLPGGEPLGLLNASYLVKAAPGWWLGPALYGAATGRRGGLFTWGAEAQRHWDIAPRWSAVGGLYLGGGGGASAPVGGGLTLRPHADLMFDFDGWAAGLSASQVRFPSGDIHSSQFGLVARVNDLFTFTEPGHGGSANFAGNGLLHIDRLDLVVGHYAHASPGGPALSYVGVHTEQALGPVLSASFEAAAAASGSADGYAEFGAGLLALWPAEGAPLRLGARGELGLAGGGAVPSGGGTVAKLALLTRLQLAPQWSVDLEAGRARAFTGAFSTPYAQVSLGHHFGAATPDAAQPVVDTEWALATQAYAHARRRDGSNGSLTALGLKYRRALGETFYAGAQAWGATSGGAGAYSVGLFGIGAATRFGSADDWRAGLEAMGGAAGGGGVSSHGGAVVQPMAWVGKDIGRYNRISLGAGVIKSVRGELSTPLVDLSWSVAFGRP